MHNNETVKFSCPSCGKGLRVPKEKAGLKGRCPACGTRIDIPFKSNLREDEG